MNSLLRFMYVCIDSLHNYINKDIKYSEKDIYVLYESRLFKVSSCFTQFLY